MAKYIKIDDRHINIEQIVCIMEDDGLYNIRMANADSYYVPINNASKKLIQGVLNADIQLPSERATKRTDRNIQ